MRCIQVPTLETIAPPAAALGAVVLAGQVAHFPLLSLFLPRALEVVGIAQIISALDRYEGEDFGACVKSDLAAAAEAGGDVVKKVAGGN